MGRGGGTQFLARLAPVGACGAARSTARRRGPIDLPRGNFLSVPFAQTEKPNNETQADGQRE